MNWIFDISQMAVHLDMDSEKETHSFSVVFCCGLLFSGGNVMFVESRADGPGYFWKLEQYLKPHNVFVANDKRMSAVGRITKVSINESCCTKIKTPWSAARFTLNNLYKKLYMNYHEVSVQATDHYEFPKERSRHLIAIAFTIRYSEDELEEAPLQLNINLDRLDLPRNPHLGIEVNLRTGRKIISAKTNGHPEKLLGGMAVLTNTSIRMQIREIDEVFAIYLMRKFDKERLKEVIFLNKPRAKEFCHQKKIAQPFEDSSCCMII